MVIQGGEIDLRPPGDLAAPQAHHGLLLATLASIAMAPLWLADVLPYDDWLDRLFGIQSWV
jgi:hypothetical protein